MAKAEARCTCKVCGQEFFVRAYRRNSREAREFEDWAVDNIDVCEDCRREAERKEAEAVSGDLPELKGTEKQVAWAYTLRVKAIKGVEKAITAYLDSSKMDLAEPILRTLKAKDAAKFWIDNRDLYPSQMIDLIAAEIQQEQKQEEAEATDQVIEPKQKQSTVLCTIEHTDDAVSVRSEYSRGVIDTLKANRYKWDGCKWVRQMSITSGDAVDRSAEIAAILLSKGYPVRVPIAIREMVLRGAYEPEHKRWLVLIKDMLVLKFEDGSSAYHDAERISGAKALKGRMISVPVTTYDEIEEFCRMHDFRVSPGAQKKIDEYRQSVTKVVPTAVSKTYADDESAVAEILSSSRDVLEDLRDED